jgi:hypothetical protein
VCAQRESPMCAGAATRVASDATRDATPRAKSKTTCMRRCQQRKRPLHAPQPATRPRADSAPSRLRSAVERTGVRAGSLQHTGAPTRLHWQPGSRVPRRRRRPRARWQRTAARSALPAWRSRPPRGMPRRAARCAHLLPSNEAVAARARGRSTPPPPSPHRPPRAAAGVPPAPSCLRGQRRRSRLRVVHPVARRRAQLVQLVPFSHHPSCCRPRGESAPKSRRGTST